MYPGDLKVESTIPPDVRADLVGRGHKVTVNHAWSMSQNAAILIDPETGSLAAGADPRTPAQALAW